MSEKSTSAKPGAADAARLLLQLQRDAEAMRHQAVDGTTLDPQLAYLRSWQTARLSATYADLLVSPRYGPAIRFFLSDIYAARDFSQRDHDLVRLHGYLSRVLPAPMLRLLSLAVELNSLTHELDAALLAELVVLEPELGPERPLTPALYGEGYRRCDNLAARAHQIDLILAVGHDVELTVRLPLAGTTLRLARAPARRAGWHQLQDFLERGFEAFKAMRGAQEFLATVAERERRILDRLFSGDPDPFGI